MLNWIEELPVGITVIDTQGIILEMNQRSAQIFAEDGGKNLIGQNAMNCHHHPREQKMLAALLKSHRRHIFTMEDNGKRVLLYQSPWFIDGAFSGYVELILDLPLVLAKIPAVSKFFQ
jgi:transcriptional regulator with PAS, ATPase and Fis domain